MSRVHFFKVHFFLLKITDKTKLEREDFKKGKNKIPLRLHKCFVSLIDN